LVLAQVAFSTFSNQQSSNKIHY